MYCWLIIPTDNAQNAFIIILKSSPDSQYCQANQEGAIGQILSIRKGHLPDCSVYVVCWLLGEWNETSVLLGGVCICTNINEKTMRSSLLWDIHPELLSSDNYRSRCPSRCPYSVAYWNDCADEIRNEQKVWQELFLESKAASLG